jgi:hypothetical protein
MTEHGQTRSPNKTHPKLLPWLTVRAQTSEALPKRPEPVRESERSAAADYQIF